MNTQERSRILSHFRRQLTQTLFWKKTVLLTAIFLLLWGVAAYADAPETAVVVPAPAPAASVAALTSAAVYQADSLAAQNGVVLKYRVLLPDHYEEGGNFPLVLFLHGAGERGDDNVSQLTWGAGMFVNPVNREKYPAVVLFPQCPAGQSWSNSMQATGDAAPLMQAVKELVDHYLASGKIDANRVYVLGLSMGGMGTFDMVCRWPELFAAAVPICGAINPGRLQSAVRVPMRIFAGDADDTVPVGFSRMAYTTLKQDGSTVVEYVEFPGVGHDSWNYAFRMPDFMQWLFAQHK